MQPIAGHILRHLRNHHYQCTIVDCHGCNILEICSKTDVDRSAVVLIYQNSGLVMLATGEDRQYRLHLSDPNFFTTITNHLTTDLS